MSDKIKISPFNRRLRWLYLAAMVVLTFTGFGNMPIYKRYYINTVPGLSWAGDFLANLQVHYLAAAVALAVTAYLAADWLLSGRHLARLTTTGLIRVILLTGVLASGGLMLLKNLASVRYAYPAHSVFTLGHMMLVMLFLLFSLGCLIAGSRWLKPV